MVGTTPDGMDKEDKQNARKTLFAKTIQKAAFRTLSHSPNEKRNSLNPSREKFEVNKFFFFFF